MTTPESSRAPAIGCLVFVVLVLGTIVAAFFLGPGTMFKGLGIGAAIGVGLYGLQQGERWERTTTYSVDALSGRRRIVSESPWRFREFALSGELLPAILGSSALGLLVASFVVVVPRLPELLPAKRAHVRSAAFTPDGSGILTYSYGLGTQIWSADGTGEPSAPWPFASGDPILSPDGKSLALVYTVQGKVRLRETDGNSVRSLDGHGDMVFGASFSPDATRLLTYSADRTARLWWVNGPRPFDIPRCVVLRGHEKGLTSAAFSPDGLRIVTTSWDGTARVWDLPGSDDPLILEGHEGSVYGATFSPDGSRIVTAGSDGTARLWSADGSGSARVFDTGKGKVRAAVFDSTGSRIVAFSPPSAVRVWTLETSSEPRLFELPRVSEHFAVSPAGTTFATASRRGVVRIARIDGSREPITLKGHGQVTSLAFSPDGSKIVTSSSGGKVLVRSADGSGEAVVLRLTRPRR